MIKPLLLASTIFEFENPKRYSFKEQNLVAVKQLTCI